MKSVRSNYSSLKYQSSPASRWKDVGIRTFEFVTKLNPFPWTRIFFRIWTFGAKTLRILSTNRNIYKDNGDLIQLVFQTRF